MIEGYFWGSVLAVFWSDNCRHDCSKSAQSQIWKSSSFQDTRPSFHVTGFVRVDEADALTDLRKLGVGALLASIGDAQKLYSDTGVYNKSPWGKELGGGGDGLKPPKKQLNLIAFKFLLTYSLTSRGCHWFWISPTQLWMPIISIMTPWFN